MNNARSTTVQGYSTLMAIFLKSLVGTNSRTKSIPAELYLAPDAFLKGLIDGYFSGVGSVSENTISCSTASEKLQTGLIHILNHKNLTSFYYELQRETVLSQT